MKRTICQTAMVPLVLVGLCGCKDDSNPCDSTSYQSGGSCLPKTDAALPEPDLAAPGPDLALVTEAAAPAVDSESGEAGSASLLGVPCTDNVTNAECQGPDTDYCAIQPGAAGYCTKSGCVTDSDCPTSWTCFDLAKMGIIGYPTMCTKPRA